MDKWCVHVQSIMSWCMLNEECLRTPSIGFNYWSGAGRHWRCWCIWLLLTLHDRLDWTEPSAWQWPMPHLGWCMFKPRAKSKPLLWHSSSSSDLPMLPFILHFLLWLMIDKASFTADISHCFCNDTNLTITCLLIFWDTTIFLINHNISSRARTIYRPSNLAAWTI